MDGVVGLQWVVTGGEIAGEVGGGYMGKWYAGFWGICCEMVLLVLVLIYRCILHPAHMRFRALEHWTTAILRVATTPHL